MSALLPAKMSHSDAGKHKNRTSPPPALKDEAALFVFDFENVTKFCISTFVAFSKYKVDRINAAFVQYSHLHGRKLTEGISISVRWLVVAL